MTESARNGVLVVIALAAALGAVGCSSTGEVSTTPPVEAATAATPKPPLAAPTGAGTYESNLGDYAIGVRDVMARYEPPTVTATGFASVLTIELVEVAGRCGEVGAGIAHPSVKSVTLRIQRASATKAEAVMKPGTYTIASAPSGDVAFSRNVLSPTCSAEAVAMPFDAALGCNNEIEVKSFDGKHVAGTYELRATDGRFVKGSFAADLCDAAAPVTSALCE